MSQPDISNSISTMGNSVMQADDEGRNFDLKNQDFRCVWYHDYGLNETIQRRMRNNLKSLFSDFHPFTDKCEFGAFFNQPTEKKIFVIITTNTSALTHESLCNIPQKCRQCQKIYKFYPSSSLQNTHDLFVEIDNLYRNVLRDVRDCSNRPSSSATESLTSTNQTPIRILPEWTIWKCRSGGNSFQHGMIDSPEFFLNQLLLEVLTRIDSNYERSLKEMFKECRLYYCGRTEQERQIDQIRNEYRQETVIRFYTADLFLFRVLGEAFRSEDIERIFKFRRYIIDLHRELSRHVIERHQQIQVKIYRGKKLRLNVIQNLKDNIDKFICMNGFLSTTRNRTTALEVFAGAEQNRDGYESVLFEFNFVSGMFNKVWADISHLSHFPEEEEILFTIASIWKIDTVEWHEDGYWVVKLSPCHEFDSRNDRYLEELTHQSIFLALGQILCDLKQHKKAEKIYRKMLDEPQLDNEMRFVLYYILGKIEMDRGEDGPASLYFEKAEQCLPPNNIDFIQWIPICLYSSTIISSPFHIYYNMGCLHDKEDRSDKALEYLQKALAIENSFPIDKAKANDRIAKIYYSEGNYQTAFQYSSRAVELSKDHSLLPKFIESHKAVTKMLQIEN